LADFLWSFEALARLCGHQDPGVRSWAADRARYLYPQEAGPLMVGLLNDREESVAVQAADYFCAYPDSGIADTLLAAFRKSSGLSAERLAHALVLLKDNRLLDAVKEKHVRIPEAEAALADFAGGLMKVALLGTKEAHLYVEDTLGHLDSLGRSREAAALFFHANLAAGTDISKLLLSAYRSGVSGYVAALLSGITYRAGGWCAIEDLAGKRASEELAAEVDDAFELLIKGEYANVAKSLKALLKRRRFNKILQETGLTALAIEQKKRREHGEDAYLRWQAQRDVPFFHCAVLSAFKETAAEIPPAQREIVACIAIIVLSLLTESRSLLALNPAMLDPDAALRIFFEDRPAAPQDDALLDLLAQSADAKSLAGEAIRRLGQFPFAEANGRIIRFAGRFIDAELARELLTVSFEDNEFADDVAKAVSSLGDLSIPLLCPLFEQNNQVGIPLALRVLEETPTEKAADLVLTHWSLLWGEYREWLLNTVTGIGDKRFIPVLKTELKAGEQAENETFRFLCLVNGITNPELNSIERESERREKRKKRLRRALEEGDMAALLREPIEIPLKCRSCHNVYHYTVDKVFAVVGTADMVIDDCIVCKQCGALDHYEIPEEGRIAVTARLAALHLLPEAAKADLDEMTVATRRSVSALGKDMPIQDLIDKYEKKLKKDSENPELLIGFANALRQGKRREDAVPIYERALKNDPLSVEGHVTLGEYAFDKGDLEAAFTHYSKAAEVMDRGNYYRLNGDRDQFKEGLLDKLMFVAEKLGRELPSPHEQGVMGEATAPPRRAVGRNHPCPCGSGKKYKKCCLLKESGQESAPTEPAPRKAPVPDPVFRRLRENLSRYIKREISRNDFLRGTGIFWNIEPREPLALPERASRDEGQFHDWFIHDYRRENGKTIMESFCDQRGNTLAAEEKRLAESLMKSYESIYEVQAVREGEGLTIRDIFTGEVMGVQEISASYEAVQWDLLQARVYKMDGVCRFAGNGQKLPRMRGEALKAYIDKARRSFEAETGRGGWPVFLKENAFLIGRFFDEVVEKPPVLLTEERHRIITAKAHFTVSDFGHARKLLSGEYDFTDEEETPSGGVSYSWLKRGPSREWKIGTEEAEKGIVATSSIVHPSGQLTFTVLGTVNLHPDRLTLECMSRERLERGKKRLLDLLRGSVRHRVDEFEDIDVAMERQEEKEEAAKPLKHDERYRTMLTSVMQKYLSAWPDTAIPALGGKTPREAAASPAGREKVLGLIKDLEYGEAQKKKNGEPFMNLGPLRKELGFGRDEG